MESTPFLVMRHNSGGNQKGAGGGMVKGVYYLDEDDIQTGLQQLVTTNEWSVGCYSATKVGLVMDIKPPK